PCPATANQTMPSRITTRPAIARPACPNPAWPRRARPGLAEPRPAKPDLIPPNLGSRSRSLKQTLMLCFQRVGQRDRWLLSGLLGRRVVAVTTAAEVLGFGADLVAWRRR